jgi:sec-independent protein translocase protein TatB
MFGIDSWEILVIAVVALVVIGPKDLPRVMRAIGNFIGQARGMARHFRSGFDAMMREAELEEMEKAWRSQNERIMKQFPSAGGPAPGAPPAGPDKAARPRSSAPPIPPAGTGAEKAAGEGK